MFCNRMILTRKFLAAWQFACATFLAVSLTITSFPKRWMMSKLLLKLTSLLHFLCPTCPCPFFFLCVPLHPSVLLFLSPSFFILVLLYVSSSFSALVCPSLSSFPYVSISLSLSLSIPLSSSLSLSLFFCPSISLSIALTGTLYPHHPLSMSLALPGISCFP